MGKLKLKKAGKVVRRAWQGAASAARGAVEVAEAIVIVAGLVEKAQRALGRRPPPDDATRPRDPPQDPARIRPVRRTR
jgi:hypothetical protein